MDWIERIFGLSPDQGSGALELEIFAALVVVGMVAFWVIARARRFRSKDR